MKKKCCEILMTVGIVLALLLLSFGLLKLPKRYFEYSDKRLGGVLSIGGYDIDNGVKSMTMEQTLDVFEKEDVLIIEEEPFTLDMELGSRLIAGSLREFLMMFFEENMKDMVEMLTDFSDISQGYYRSTACSLIYVENEEIYSVRLGILVFRDYWNNSAYLNNLEILFNRDTYEILGVNLYGADMMWAEFDRYLDKETDIMERLNGYYGGSRPWEKTEMEFGGNYFFVTPLTADVMEGKVFRALAAAAERAEFLYFNPEYPERVLE